MHASVEQSPTRSKASDAGSEGEGGDKAEIARLDFVSLELSHSGSHTGHVHDATEYAPEPPKERPSFGSMYEDGPWENKALLSLDGGGVRGLSSLLILKRLMERIGEHEQQLNKYARSSSHSPFFGTPTTKERRKTGSDEYFSNDWLPCHYFDYIGGTSTGGLIAIMLGRLRMNIDDAIAEYKELCKNVFEKPSSRLKRFWNNYNGMARRQELETRFENMAVRRPSRSPSEEREQFRSDPGRCSTIVCSIRSAGNGPLKEPFLFRSYDHHGTEYRTEDESIIVLEPRPSNPDQSFMIWEVAQAVSAAPSVFKPIALPRGNGNFYDGGVNMNNPSWLLLREVLHRADQSNENLDILLSIGGGNARAKSSKKQGRRVIALLEDSVSYSDYAAQRVRKESINRHFRYHRLDVEPGFQDVRLDEWKPKESGKTTVQRIEQQTEEYLKRPRVAQECKDIAQRLAEARISRSQTIRWESFAAGIRYTCKVPGCPLKPNLFSDRNQLMDHLRMQHGKSSPDSEHYKDIEKLLNDGRIDSG